MKLSLAFLLAFILLPEFAGGADEQYLKEYASALEASGSMKFQAEVTRTSGKTGAPYTTKEDWQLCTSKELFSTTVRYPDSEFLVQRLWKPAHYIDVSLPNGAEGTFTLTAKLSENNRLIANSNSLGPCSLIFGRFNDGVAFPSVVEKVVNPQISQKGSRVTMRTETGTEVCTLVLDTDRGCAPVRLDYSRHARQNEGGPFRIEYDVSDWLEVEGNSLPSRYKVTRSISSYEMELPAGVFIVDGRMVAGDASLVPNAQTTRKVPKSSSVYEVKLSSVQLSVSENDFKPIVAIPDGTSVSVVESMHLPHVWVQGAVVPQANVDLGELGDFSFSRYTIAWRTLVLFLIVAGLGAVVVFWRRGTRTLRR